VGATSGSIIVLDESGQARRHTLIKGELATPVTEQVVAQILDKGLAGWVVQHKEGAIVFDTRGDERWLALNDDHLATRSAIAVPLLRQERVVGVLTLSHPEPNRFNEEHLDLLSSIANQAAIAVENARLYDDSQRRLHELSALYEVSQAASSLRLDETLRLIAERTARALRADRCALFLLDEERGDLVLRAVDNPDRPAEALGLRLPLEARPHVAEAIAARRPVEIPDIFADPSKEDFWPLARELDLQACLAVPIMVKERVIGAISLDRVGDQPPFSADEVSLCQTIANQAAIAIERARLYFAERRLHTTIAEERAKLQAIIGGTNDAIIVTDAQNRVLLMNQAAQRAFDVKTVPELGKPLGEVVSNERLLALFVRPEAREEALAEEIPLSDGRTLYASLTPVAEIGRVVVMQDITYLKELDKMKSDFVATVSHDLRSPLSIITGYALLLPEAGELNETQQEFIEVISRSASKMTTLIDNLLDLGKIEARVEMEMKPCQLVTVINKAIGSLREQAGAKEIALQLDLPPELPFVQGNQVRLDQVVSNLVGNAIKFTSEGGMVTVSAREEKGEVVVEVKDTGIGIASEDQVHLFEKFYRVRSEEASDIEGTGLGLAIVKSIVEGHRGRVWVKSEPSQGSTFGFALPIAP
jgi:signal transduction histidine kinase